MFALCFLVGSLATVAISAVLCAKRRAHKAYLRCVAVLTAVGIALVFMTLPPHHTRLDGAIISVVMYAPLGVLYAFVPGYLVRRGAARKEIVFTTAIITLVGFPSGLDTPSTCLATSGTIVSECNRVCLREPHAFGQNRPPPGVNRLARSGHSLNED
jgi:hypothetical protein